MAFAPGDLVWAKLKSYPQWPARIEHPPADKTLPPFKYAVFFFGTHERVILHSNSLCSYEENKKRFTRHNSRWKFAEGLEEIEGNPLIGFNSQDKDDVDLTDFPSETAQEEKSTAIQPESITCGWYFKEESDHTIELYLHDSKSGFGPVFGIMLSDKQGYEDDYIKILCKDGDILGKVCHFNCQGSEISRNILGETLSTESFVKHWQAVFAWNEKSVAAREALQSQKRQPSLTPYGKRQTRKRKLSTNSFVESFGDLDQRNGSDNDELTECDPWMDDEEYDDEDDNNVNDSDNAGVDDVKFIRKVGQFNSPSKSSEHGKHKRIKKDESVTLENFKEVLQTATGPIQGNLEANMQQLEDLSGLVLDTRRKLKENQRKLDYLLDIIPQWFRKMERAVDRLSDRKYSYTPRHISHNLPKRAESALRTSSKTKRSFPSKTWNNGPSISTATMGAKDCGGPSTSTASMDTVQCKGTRTSIPGMGAAESRGPSTSTVVMGNAEFKKSSVRTGTAESNGPTISTAGTDTAESGGPSTFTSSAGTAESKAAAQVPTFTSDNNLVYIGNPKYGLKKPHDQVMKVMKRGNNIFKLGVGLTNICFTRETLADTTCSGLPTNVMNAIRTHVFARFPASSYYEESRLWSEVKTKIGNNIRHHRRVLKHATELAKNKAESENVKNHEGEVEQGSEPVQESNDS